MEKVLTIEFEHKVSPRVALEAVAKRGGCAIHNFAAIEQLQAAAELIRSQRMKLDENLTARVQRRQHMNKFVIGSEDTPALLEQLAGDIETYVNLGGFSWKPNEIIAHRYDDDDFISRHRDHSNEARGVIAVLTLDGIQDFYVELDGDKEATKITLRPGTLTILRGFNGNPNERPYHWVGRPASQRTAISIRDMQHMWTPLDGDWA